jgi:hypothetical protein
LTSFLPSPPQEPADPVATGPADAVADLRTTARWTIVAVAGVGALLVGGGPLTAVGRIDDWGDTFAAFGGLALTVLGVGWAIWQTGEALTPCLATLDDLDAPEMASLRAAIARNPAAYYGPYRSLRELRTQRRLHEAVAADLAVKLAREQDPVRTKIFEQGLADARANAEEARRLQHRLLTLIHAWSVRHAVRRARLHTLAAFGLVALGAVLFLTATGDKAADPPAKQARSASAAPDGAGLAQTADRLTENRPGR